MGFGSEGGQRESQAEDHEQHVFAGGGNAPRRDGVPRAVSASTVEQTQQQIVDIIRRLEDTGEISVASGDEVEERH